MSKQAGKRIARRVRLQVPVGYVQGNRTRGVGHLTDLSAGGCSLGKVLLDPKGSEVFLHFRLGVDQREIGLRGRVAHVQEGVGTGIEFTSISPEDRDLLRHFVEEKSAEKNPHAKRS